jgi:hypothetical protein
VARTEIGNLANNSSAQVSTLNSYFTSMAAQVVQEDNLQIAAEIDFANLIPNSSPTVYSLIYSLPSYGAQTQEGGLFQFWEGVANINTFTGQAIVATLREGVNRSVLGNAGILTNALVPADANPPQPPANLIPSTYTEQQAANLVVR